MEQSEGKNNCLIAPETKPQNKANRGAGLGSTIPGHNYIAVSATGWSTCPRC